jgi:hypothetical protein
MILKKTIGYNVLRRFAQWRLLLLILFFDLLFFVSLYSMASLFDSFFALYQTILVGTWGGSLSVLGYFLFVVLVYSFFKYCILHFTSAFFGKQVKKLDFSRIRWFYLYNICLFSVFAAVIIGVLFFFTIALESITQPGASQAFIVAFLVVSYLFVQVSHALFFQRKDVKIQYLAGKVWKKLTMNMFGRYIGWNILYGGVFVLIFVALGTFMEFAGTQALGSDQWYVLFFILNVFMMVYLACATYFLMLWNRVYVYALVERQ